MADFCLGYWLKTARRVSGLSLDELSVRIDGVVSAQSLSKYERGVMKPHADVLERIASALSLPGSWFMQQRTTVTVKDYRHRIGINETDAAKTIAYVQSRMDELSVLRTMLGQKQTFVNPVSDIGDVQTGKDVEWAVEILRGRWNIGCQPIHSVYQLLESFGAQVVETDFESASVDGISFMIDEIPVIVINTRTHQTVERKRFTALHELCHLMLNLHAEGSNGLQSDETDAETLCNRFANAMLIPVSMLMRELGSKRERLTMGELVSVRNTYGISIAAIVHRLHDLEIISEDYYHHIFENYIKNNPLEEGWGSYSVPEVPRVFNMLLSKAVAEGKLPNDCLARYSVKLSEPVLDYIL